MPRCNTGAKQRHVGDGAARGELHCPPERRTPWPFPWDTGVRQELEANRTQTGHAAACQRVDCTGFARTKQKSTSAWRDWPHAGCRGAWPAPRARNNLAIRRHASAQDCAAAARLVCTHVQHAAQSGGGGSGARQGARSNYAAHRWFWTLLSTLWRRSPTAIKATPGGCTILYMERMARPCTRFFYPSGR